MTYLPSKNTTKVGTPANNQFAVWTGDGTLEGVSGLTYDGTTATVPAASVSGLLTLGGASVVAATAMGALVIDVTKPLNTKSITADQTLTFSNNTPTAGTRTEVKITVDATDRVVTLPVVTIWSYARDANITTVTIPASTTMYLAFEYTGSRWEVYGDPVDTDGTGAYIRATAFSPVDNRATGLPMQLQNVTTANRGTDPKPIAYFDDLLWGFKPTDGGIYSCANWTATSTLTWTLVQLSGLSNIFRLVKCASDGEVIAACTDGIYRSTNWPTTPGTPNWTNKFTVTAGGNASVNPVLFDVNDATTCFIVGEYAAGAAFEQSRKVSISRDSGNSFTLEWDSDTLWGSVLNDLTHLHTCGIDANGGYWISEGHTATVGGLYYSSTGVSGSFAKMTDALSSQYDGGFISFNRFPDCIVLGTDNLAAGLWRIPLCGNQINAVSEQIYTWKHEPASDQLGGFCESQCFDPVTGIAVVGFTAAATSVKAIMVATDGKSANEIYRFSDAVGTGGPQRMVAYDGLLISEYLNTGGGTSKIIRGEIVVGLQSTGKQASDPINAVNPSTSMALGDFSSITGACPTSVVIGPRSTLSGSASRSVVIGAASSANEANMIVIGPELTATGVNNSIWIGKDHTGTGDFQFLLGITCNLGALGVMAIGGGIVAPFADAIALGQSITIGGTANTIIGKSVATGGSDVTSMGSTVVLFTTAKNVCNLGNNASLDEESTNVGKGSSLGQYCVNVGSGNNTVGTYGSATAYACTNVGYSSNVSATEGSSIGYNSDCDHARSIVLGSSTDSTAVDQATIGARHLEMTEVTTPASPAANGIRLYIEDNGSGKTRLMALFATGAAVQIAIEP